MKKSIFTFSLVIVTMVLFAQSHPAAWSGAKGVTPAHSTNIEPINAPTLLPGGSLLWSQGPGCISSISSEVISSFGLTSNCADDFILTSANTISAARWWFGIYNGIYAPFTSWNITIYDNAACLPGNIVQQWTIPFNQSNETFQCASQLAGDTYSYWADLSPAFVAAANTTYWISVQTGDHSLPPGQWGWDNLTTITGCEAAFQSAFFGFPAYLHVSQLGAGALDFSFELYGPGVPETPVSNWALFIGIGLILIFTVIRFRRLI
jgi:hypothetical protein